MNKTTKGALAAVTAGVLLLGGAGTLAYWTDDETISGGAVNTGHLALLVDETNLGCGDWELDGGETAPTTYTLGDPLVPGDVLSRVCDYTIDAAGNHLRATVGLSTPSLTENSVNSFGETITAAVTGVTVNDLAATEFTEANDGQKLSATVTVSFDETAGNSTQDVEAVLADLTLTATQVHS